jgi:hypothetical protein
MINANYDAPKITTCKTTLGTNLGACSTTCSNDMPITTAPEIRAQEMTAVVEVSRWMKDNVCDKATIDSNDIKIFTSAASSDLLTIGGGCTTTAGTSRCINCMSWRTENAAQRVKGIKRCAMIGDAEPTAGYPTDVPRPLRTCTTIEIAGADADTKSDQDATAAADTTTATGTCYTDNSDATWSDAAVRLQKIKACQLDQVTTAIATAITVRGGHACDAKGTNPTCTDNSNTCVSAVCVCAAGRNGEKCDKTDAEAVPPTALAAYIHDAALKNVADKMLDCVSLLQVGDTTVKGVLPDQAWLDTCDGQAKTLYKNTVGVVADPSAQDWMAVKFAAADRKGRKYMHTCSMAAYLLTADKESALKRCSVIKDQMVSTILGRVHQYPCSTTCNGETDGCFDDTHLLSKVRLCNVADTTAEIYTKLGPANAAKVEEANTATGSAVVDCMTSVRELYADNTACDADKTACDAARLACTSSVATTAVAGALGVETSDATMTPATVRKAVVNGAVAALQTNIANCMSGVYDQNTADAAKYDAATLVTAQKKCVQDSEDKLALSLGEVDKSSLEKGALEHYIENAAGSAMVAGIKACTAVATTDSDKMLCVQAAGKAKYMETKGGDAAVNGALVSKSDVRVALNDALRPEVTTTVKECVKLATDDAMKTNCVWTAAKATLADSTGITIDTATRDGKAALIAKVADAAKAGVVGDVKACAYAARAAHSANPTALTAALAVCRDTTAKDTLVGALAKPAATITKEVVKAALADAGATSLLEGNAACRKAALAITDAAAQLQAKKDCFAAAAGHVADAKGVTYDATASTGTTTTASADTLNNFDLQETKGAAAAQAVAQLAAACKTENDAASCTPTKIVEQVAAAYGTNSDGEDPIDITTATTATSIDENKAKLVRVVKRAALAIISDAADACTDTDETNAAISSVGTDEAANGVRECAKAFAEANGYYTLKEATIPAYASTSQSTKDKRWKRDYNRAVIKKMCMRFRLCNTDETKGAGACMTEAIAFAKKYIVNTLVTDAWVKKALFKCRAHLRATANECDSTMKGDCKAVLDDPRTDGSENTVGANAPATVNEGGKTNEAGVERDNAALDAAAQAYADCRDAFATADWTAKKYDCREIARSKFELYGGNGRDWSSVHMAKVETLGNDYYAGGESQVVTNPKPSVDYEVAFTGACTAEKTASVNTLVKTACNDASCSVKDIEQVTLTASSKCNFKFRVKHSSCTDKTSCDAFSATLVATQITFNGRRRRLAETAKPLAGTTTDICPSTGCTYPPEGKVGASVQSHPVARRHYIECMIKANFDTTAGEANAKVMCRKALVAALALCTVDRCSDDMPVTDEPGIAEQMRRAVAGTHAYFMQHVCNVVDFTASGLTLYDAAGAAIDRVTGGGNCAASTPTASTKRMCMMCMARIEHAQRRVEGVRACGTTDSTSNLVARPTRICDPAQTAAADADAADATQAAGEADTVTASQTCHTTHGADLQGLRQCQLDSVTAAIATATTASGGHACDASGTNPTCTDNSNACVDAVCVCAAGRNGERCDKTDGDVVKPADLASYIRRAALKRLAEQMQMCVRLLQVDEIATEAGVLPTQNFLTTCAASTKADYVKTIGASVSDEEWTAAQQDASAIAVREYMEPCTKTAFAVTDATAKATALKLCDVQKDQIVATVKGKPYMFPCVDTATCSTLAKGCFDGTHLLSKVRSCTVDDTKAEIFSMTAPAAADKADAADAATGDAVFDCVSKIRKMYENKAACDGATNNACRVAMKACYVDVAKTAIATTLGVEEADVTATQVEAAVFDGAVIAVKDTVGNCMEGIKNSDTANDNTYNPTTKIAAQKACAATAAKDALVTSYGLSDATELKAGAVENAVRKAAGKSMIDAIEACTTTGTKDAAAKALCVQSAGKKAMMTTQGLDFDVAGSTVPKSDIRVAYDAAMGDEVATTVTECAKLAATAEDKRKCRWMTLKDKLASANGETIDTATTAGKTALGKHVKKGAKFAVRKALLACMRAAKAAHPSDATARYAAFKACREDKSPLADGLAKPLVEVTKEDLAESVRASGAEELADRNRACRQAAMALATPAEQKAALAECFTASIVVCADAIGVHYDATKKTENADATMNALKFEEVRELAKNNQLAARAAACQKENDGATECTAEKFVGTIVEAYGTDAAGEPTVDIAATGGLTKLAVAVKHAAVTVIDGALDACTEKDSAGAAIAAPGTTLTTCVKESAVASGYDVLTGATILPGRPVDVPTKEKLFTADVMHAVMKKICYRFRQCMMDSTKDKAACTTEIMTYAKRFFQVSGVHVAVVSFVLTLQCGRRHRTAGCTCARSPPPPPRAPGSGLRRERCGPCSPSALHVPRAPHRSSWRV